MQQRVVIVCPIARQCQVRRGGNPDFPFTCGSPKRKAGARSALILDHEEVGAWLRVRAAARPLAVHAAWRTDADTAAAVVLASTIRGRFRTPPPLRAARHAARGARAEDGG